MCHRDGDGVEGEGGLAVKQIGTVETGEGDIPRVSVVTGSQSVEASDRNGQSTKYPCRVTCGSGVGVGGGESFAMSSTIVADTTMAAGLPLSLSKDGIAVPVCSVHRRSVGKW